MNFLEFMGAFLFGVVAVVALELFGIGTAINNIGMGIQQAFQGGIESATGKARFTWRRTHHHGNLRFHG